MRVGNIEIGVIKNADGTPMLFVDHCGRRVVSHFLDAESVNDIKKFVDTSETSMMCDHTLAMYENKIEELKNEITRIKAAFAKDVMESATKELSEDQAAKYVDRCIGRPFKLSSW